MSWDPREALEKVKGKATEMGAQKAVETMSQAMVQTMNQANLLLTLLQNAGYLISEVNLELSVPPKVTIDLKAGPTATDAKLDAVFQANKDNDVLSTILGALIQANRLRDMVKQETIALNGAKIELKAPPSISLQWKDKAAATAATAG